MKKSEQIRQSITQTKADIAAAHTQIGEWTAEAGGRAAQQLASQVSGLQSSIRQWEANVARMAHSLPTVEMAEAAADRMEAEEAARQAEQERQTAQAREDASREAAWNAFHTSGGGTYTEFLEAWPQIRRTVATEAATHAAATAVTERHGVDPVLRAAQDALIRKYGGGMS